MGATFNRELTREGARISAYETKAGSIPWTYAPVTDLGRDPRWPRMWENYGEDAYVNAEMGREAVIGFQGENPNLIGENNVAACMKHYMGYGVPVSGKDRTPSSITEQDMREKHFAPYLEMVKAGALSVMVNLSLIHISEPTRPEPISYAVFCLKKIFFNDTATTEIYTLHIVGSVRCV